MKRLLFSICVILLFGCAKHSDGSSVWAGGLFLIPTIFFIGVAIFGYKTLVGYNSGSEGGKKVVPVGYLVFTIGCLIGAIGSILWIISEK